MGHTDPLPTGPAPSIESLLKRRFTQSIRYADKHLHVQVTNVTIRRLEYGHDKFEVTVAHKTPESSTATITKWTEDYESKNR